MKLKTYLWINGVQRFNGVLSLHIGVLKQIRGGLVNDLQRLSRKWRGATAYWYLWDTENSKWLYKGNVMPGSDFKAELNSKIDKVDEDIKKRELEIREIIVSTLYDSHLIIYSSSFKDVGDDDIIPISDLQPFFCPRAGPDHAPRADKKKIVRTPRAPAAKNRTKKIKVGAK